MSRLTNLGYANFHKEVNLLSAGASCAEFSLVKLDISCPPQFTELAETLNLRRLKLREYKKNMTEQLYAEYRDIMVKLKAINHVVDKTTIELPYNKYIY